jgi:O-methyltransferase
MSKIVEDLLLQHKLISDQVSIKEIRLVLESILKVIVGGLEGDICEFGCYSGTTSLFISRLLVKLKSEKKLWVYDSFIGLPEKGQKDASPAGIEFKPGELRFSKKSFIENYKKANLKLPIIKKGWFSDLSLDDLPEKICLAFLDGDYYESILTPLNLIQNRLQPGSIIIVDDYANPKLPGASRALDEWLSFNRLDSLKRTVVDDAAVARIS